MIKYRTGGLGNNLIEPVEVARETPKQVVKLVETFSGELREEKSAKISDYYQYHDTWEDAHAYLLANAERKVESARMNLEREKGYYGNIKGLKKPISQEG